MRLLQASLRRVTRMKRRHTKLGGVASRCLLQKGEALSCSYQAKQTKILSPLERGCYCWVLVALWWLQRLLSWYLHSCCVCCVSELSWINKCCFHDLQNCNVLEVCYRHCGLCKVPLRGCGGVPGKRGGRTGWREL